MNKQKLMKVTYYDPKNNIRLTGYSDTVVWDDKGQPTVVLCPSHVTRKWVREVEETVPNTFASVVHNIQEFDHLYRMYERGTKNCFAIISKEKARDGYMRASAVIRRRWNRDSLSVERKIPIPSCGAVDMELPGVSPLVYSRFLMEYAVFLSLTDMGKDLPEYEEIPIPLSMPEEVEKEYERVESVLKSVLKNDRKAVKKILSSYLNLLTAYPDQR